MLVRFEGFPQDASAAETQPIMTSSPCFLSSRAQEHGPDSRRILRSSCVRVRGNCVAFIGSRGTLSVTPELKDDRVVDSDGDTSEFLPVDLGLGSRIINAIVDIGAYEGVSQHFVLSDVDVTVPEGGAATFAVALALQPDNAIEVIVTVQEGDSGISVSSGAMLHFGPDDYSDPQIATLSAVEDIDLVHGTAVIGVSAAGIRPADLLAVESDNEAVPPILYVDRSNQTGLNIGTSWTDAFMELRDGLLLASSRGGVEEIWAARGTYAPAPSGGERSATFQLPHAVAVYGGFAGGETDREQRDPAENETILSGDLNGDDGPDFQGNGENSYHAVTSSGTGNLTRLDGFTITGGMHTHGGDPALSNCTFRSNLVDGSYLRVAGGLYNAEGNPTISYCTNCVLWGNLDDGGMDESAQMDNDTSSTPSNPVVNYSCVQGWTGTLGGTGNIGDDPLLVDADGPDDVPGTEDDILRLSPGSPCIDAADNTAVPPDTLDLDADGDTAERTPLDLGGNLRFTDDCLTDDNGVSDPPDYVRVVDMGAYEYQPNDVDDDGDVDLRNLADFLGCFSGEGGDGITPECEHFDADCDGDLDLHDLASFGLSVPRA